MIAAGLGLAAAVLAVFLVFGSSGNPTVDPIAQAATVSSQAPGFRMKMTLSLTSSAFGGAITGYGDAVVDPGDHAFSSSFVMDFSSFPQVAQVLGGTTMRMDVVMHGQAVYMKLPQALLGRLPNFGNKPWLRIDAAKADGIPGLSSLGNGPATANPAQVLQYLRAASDSVSNEGRQMVDGVPTTHYHAELSLDRVAAGLPAGEQDAVRQALDKLRQATGGTDLPIDVWVDAHHLVRQTAMSISLHAEGQSVQESVVADITDYGSQPRPAVPPADQVQDATGFLPGGMSG